MKSEITRTNWSANVSPVRYGVFGTEWRQCWCTHTVGPDGELYCETQKSVADKVRTAVLTEEASRRLWRWLAYSGWGMTFVTIATWIVQRAS